MTFNSVDFLFFFPTVFLLFFSLPSRWQHAFLFLVSLCFYGYASTGYLFLLLASRALDYWIVRRLDAEQRARFRTGWLLASLVLNLGVLFLFKYFNFFSGIGAQLSGHALGKLSLALPFGLSFYTFHALSYTLDIYNSVLPAEKNFSVYCSYISFFPHLVAGPIARAHRLLPQFKTKKQLKLDNLIAGSYLVAKGFFMKLVIADALGGYVDAHFSSAILQTPMQILQAVYYYPFQVYCDFAGYTSIARGIAKWMDFDLDENFRAPYLATSITDFWKRWHISLTSWFRDYLFYPMVLTFGRTSRWLPPFALVIVFALSGLWHGASWTFIFWGALNGVYLSVERALGPTPVGEFFRTRVPVWVRGLLTFHLILIGCVFFRSPTFAEAGRILGSLSVFVFHPLASFALSTVYLKLALLIGVLLSFEWLEEKKNLFDRFCRAAWQIRAAALYAAILAISLLAELNPLKFLYLQF